MARIDETPVHQHIDELMRGSVEKTLNHLLDAEALWGTKVSPSTVSKLNQEIYKRIEQRRNQPLPGTYPYISIDGIVLKNSWVGEIRCVSVLVAIAVNGDGYREIIGVAEGAKEDKAG